MRNSEIYINRIVSVLNEMENRGDLVITTTSNNNLAEEIYSSIVKSWLEENTDFEEPIEFTLPKFLEKITAVIQNNFGLTEGESKEISEKYHKTWLEQRTPKEVAELYWHQGPQDIALRAYYTVKLGNNDKEMDFLDWRKKYGA